MDFGEWIRLLRKEQKLDLQSLAERSNVEASTISRLENARTQITLQTAIRLCEGLGMTVEDLLQVVYGNRSVPDDREKPYEKPLVPKLRDVEQFLTDFHQDEELGKLWLSYLLNKIASMSSSESKGDEKVTFLLFVPEDIQKLLLNMPLYRFEIQYPPTITSKDILSIYRLGGVLSLTDIGEYIKKLRRERQVTLDQMEEKVKLSPSILSRLEAGFTEQIKLSDVLLLDQQLGQEGILLSMYWEAYNWYERVIGNRAASAGQDLKLIMLFIIVCRWLQCINPFDISWKMTVLPIRRSA
jgi:transcriptional regulator with XRE-family HTH domain